MRYSNGMESNLMNGMCGIRPGFALSGLIDLLMTFARGVAPGWFVVAPSGRHCTGLGSKSARLMLGLLLFVVSSSSFAAESRLADAAEKSDRTTVRALLKRHADVNAPQSFAPKGLQQTSPGQRPGLRNGIMTSPERATQSQRKRRVPISRQEPGASRV